MVGVARRRLNRAFDAMTEIVNLNRIRKQAKRNQQQALAQQNRLIHGRTKAEKELARTQTAAARRHLDNHRIETGDDA